MRIERGDLGNSDIDSDVEVSKIGEGGGRRVAPRALAAALPYLPYLAYLLAAVALLGQVWRDPAGRMLADNYQDQVFFEWLLTNAANAITDLDNPMFTGKLNSPYGLNLMANTSILALALPLAPLTLMAGPHVTFVVLLTLALAGTAAAWYFVLNTLLRHRAAAVIGGAFCGFAPAMISQATGHPNIAGQYLLPFIVLTVLRLGTPDPKPGHGPVSRGLILAALVVVQAFINEELLLLTALALAVFLLAYTAARPRELASRVPDALKSLATTALVAGAALAYPLYHQFFGPGHYRGLPEFVLTFGADLAGYWSFARRSVAGDVAAVARLAQGPTEENTFFGWPLLIALLAVIFWLRSDPVVRAVAFTAVTFCVLSLGSVVKLGGVELSVGGPWGLLDGLPILDSVVPTRLALVVTPLVGTLLAIAVARFDAAATTRSLRGVGLAALLLVLLPLTPTPLPTFQRPYSPPFFTTGAFRDHVPPGGVVFAVPPGWNSNLHAMQWQTAAGHDFAIFGGYFLAPDPNDPDRRAMFGTAYRPTVGFLERVAQSGQAITVTSEQRAQVLADLRFMKATTIVMAAHHPRAEPVRAVVDQIVGPGRLVGGVWVWDVPAT